MRILQSRRFMIGLAAIVALVVLAVYNGIDTSTAIAAVAMGVAGSNAVQKLGGNSDGRGDS